jgi:alpha(1,3/1,4) fucosyltransferase
VLALHYDVRTGAADPAIVFHGDGTTPDPATRALAIQVHHENRYPDFRKFHYAIGFRHLDHPRWFRWPLYPRTCSAAQLIKDPDFVERTVARKDKFCTLVATNANKVRVWRRLEIAERLSRHTPVDFGGRYRNNVGGPVADKLAFYAPYRFAIAFENGGMRGHTTEKLTDAMLAGCIPIFWGNPEIAAEFNPGSFVNAHEFGTLDAVVERVIEIDRSESLYRRYLAEPWFHDNRPNEAFDPAPLAAFLQRAIESPRPPLYAFYPQYRLADWSRKLGFVADWAAGKAGLGIAGPA